MTTAAQQSAPSADDSAQATALGLRKLAWIGATFALLGLATYALPGSQRLRPWVPGEGVPIVRMFEDSRSELPEFAEASVQSNAEVSRHDVGADLGDQVAKNLGDDEGEGDAHAGGGATGPRGQVLPSEYEGITQHIEHPEALKAFFTKLTAVAGGKQGAIARVAHYGDSAVAADAITSTARRRLQQRFGDSGHGFVLARGPMHYYHKDVVQHSSDGWEVNSIVQLGLSPGLYGYGGVMTRGGNGEKAYFGTVKDGHYGNRVSRFELFYQRSRGGGSLELKVDGERKSLVSTRTDKKPEDAFEVIDVPDGEHLLAIKAIGNPSRVYGVALERDVPGVVYDSLGIVGAVAERLLGAEPEHIDAQIAHRDPDMLVLAFGGNESANEWLNIDQYQKDLTKVVEHMRHGKPAMSCLLFGPIDQGEKDKRGKIVTVKVLPKIVEAQRKVAAQQGCAFFDAFAAMGGEGAMGKWIKSRPKLATSDLRHATPAGYEVVGNMYYKALLEAFAGFAGGRSGS